MQNLSKQTGLSEDLLSDIISLLQKHEVTKAVLFGSRSRGDFTDTSDVDIAYWGEVDEPMLWLDIEQLPTIHKIDLVAFEQISNQAFQQNILRDATDLAV